MKDDKICSKADQNTDDFDVLRTGLDQKIIEATQAQPVVQILMQEIITLRSEINSLLETQLASRQSPYEGLNTEQILTVPELDAPADT